MGAGGLSTKPKLRRHGLLPPCPLLLSDALQFRGAHDPPLDRESDRAASVFSKENPCKPEAAVWPGPENLLKHCRKPKVQKNQAKHPVPVAVIASGLVGFRQRERIRAFQRPLNRMAERPLDNRKQGQPPPEDRSNGDDKSTLGTGGNHEKNPGRICASPSEQEKAQRSQDLRRVRTEQPTLCPRTQDALQPFCGGALSRCFSSLTHSDPLIDPGESASGIATESS